MLLLIGLVVCAADFFMEVEQGQDCHIKGTVTPGAEILCQGQDIEEILAGIFQRRCTVQRREFTLGHMSA